MEKRVNGLVFWFEDTKDADINGYDINMMRLEHYELEDDSEVDYDRDYILIGTFKNRISAVNFMSALPVE